MKKCIKISLVSIDDTKKVFNELKEVIGDPGVEGVAYVADTDSVEMVAYGDKEKVDELVASVEDLVVAYEMQEGSNMYVFVEPHIKDENFRGLFRFVQPQ